jgi:cytosine/creatinine deaminase
LEVDVLDDRTMLEIAIAEAKAGLAEGGIPIGAAIFTFDGELVSRGHNRRVQDNDPSSHGETDAFRRAGRQPTWRDKVLVTTLTPCWYCTGLVRQFRFPRIVVGETISVPQPPPSATLVDLGVEVVDLASEECIEMMAAFKAAQPDLWNEDGGNT